MAKHITHKLSREITLVLRKTIELSTEHKSGYNPHVLFFYQKNTYIYCSQQKVEVKIDIKTIYA